VKRKVYFHNDFLLFLEENKEAATCSIRLKDKINAHTAEKVNLPKPVLLDYQFC